MVTNRCSHNPRPSHNPVDELESAIPEVVILMYETIEKRTLHNWLIRNKVEHCTVMISPGHLQIDGKEIRLESIPTCTLSMHLHHSVSWKKENKSNSPSSQSGIIMVPSSVPVVLALNPKVTKTHTQEEKFPGNKSASSFLLLVLFFRRIYSSFLSDDNEEEKSMLPGCAST
jgi:hypothetical protein